jgi:hypothetical protein
MFYGDKGGTGSEIYARYTICREMGWDYYTYEAQPASFIDEIRIIMQQEAQKAIKDQKEAKING